MPTQRNVTIKHLLQTYSSQDVSCLLQHAAIQVWAKDATLDQETRHIAINLSQKCIDHLKNQRAKVVDDVKRGKTALANMEAMTTCQILKHTISTVKEYIGTLNVQVVGFDEDLKAWNVSPLISPPTSSRPSLTTEQIVSENRQVSAAPQTRQTSQPSTRQTSPKNSKFASKRLSDEDDEPLMKRTRHHDQHHEKSRPARACTEITKAKMAQSAQPLSQDSDLDMQEASQMETTEYQPGHDRFRERKGDELRDVPVVAEHRFGPESYMYKRGIPFKLPGTTSFYEILADINAIVPDRNVYNRDLVGYLAHLSTLPECEGKIFVVKDSTTHRNSCAHVKTYQHYVAEDIVDYVTESFEKQLLPQETESRDSQSYQESPAITPQQSQSIILCTPKQDSQKSQPIIGSDYSPLRGSRTQTPVNSCTSVIAQDGSQAICLLEF